MDGRVNERQIEMWIYEYMVTLHLFKAIEWDRKNAASMKLSRIWEAFFEQLARSVEKRHVDVKRKLRRSGCRIVLEEVTEKRDVHMMYVYKGYEYHSTIMPAVLKGKCEEKLGEMLWSDWN